jgi:hypothetical protein
MVKKKFKNHKEYHREKTKEVIKRLIIQGGELPVMMYVVLSSIWISISAGLYVYSVNASSFKLLIQEGFGSYIFFMYGQITLLMFFVFLSFGILSLFIFRAKIRMEDKGVQKPKNLVEEIFDDINKNKKKEKVK